MLLFQLILYQFSSDSFNYFLQPDPTCIKPVSITMGMSMSSLGILQGYPCQSLSGRVHVGVALLQSGRAEGPACFARLQKHSYMKGQVIQTGLSIETGSSAASTGWQGITLPKSVQEHILPFLINSKFSLKKHSRLVMHKDH